MLHVAVHRCNIEMIKILMIYGADLKLRRVKTTERPPFYQSRRKERDQGNEEDRDVAMRTFCDREWKSGPLQEALDIHQILERAKCGDQNVKKEIDALLRSESNWFPELLDLYPGDQGEALRFMYREWQSPLPLEVVSVIAQFYYLYPGDDGGSTEQRD